MLYSTELKKKYGNYLNNERFEEKLNTGLNLYLNGEDGGKWGLVLNPILEKLWVKKRAKVLGERYKNYYEQKKKARVVVIKNGLGQIKKGLNKSSLEMLSKLVSMKKEIKDSIVGIYLHGSYATLDFVEGWSDMDIVVVLKRVAVHNFKTLVRLRKYFTRIRPFFYRIDPYQHHLFFFLTEYELNNYNQQLLPMKVFSGAVALVGSNKLSFKTRDNSFEKKRVLLKFVLRALEVAEGKRVLRNAYQIKLFFSMMMLLPCLYLQAKGKDVEKKDSFEKAKREFSGREWRVIDTLSQIRKTWKSPKVSKSSLLLNYALSYFVHPVEPDILKEICSDSGLFALACLKNLEYENYLL